MIAHVYIILQIILFLIVSVLITSFLKKGKGWLSVLFAFLISLQIAAYYIGSSLIDYRFFVHINWGNLSQISDFFSGQILLFLLLFLVIFMLLNFLNRRYNKNKRKRKRGRVAFITGSLILMMFPSGAINNIWQIWTLSSADTSDLNQALLNLNIDPDDYTFPDEVEAKPGKNIIVISMESFESGFLSDSLAHLTPNLRKFAKQYSHFEMPESPGSNWTAGSIYTSITGFPAFFKNPPNFVFQQTTEGRISGVGHVLRKAGYQLNYMLGMKEYAGVGDMLTTYGFDVRSERDFDEKYEQPRWGLHDMDLFKEAKKQIERYDKGKPFALFLATMSTHPDDGIYDSRMEGVIPNQKSRLEFMASATDYYIGELLEFLEKEGLSDNTVVYLFPDHLMMGLAPRVLNDFPPNRELFVLTNADRDQLSFPPEEKILQIDLPQLILDGAEVEHNVKFLSQYIADSNKRAFIEDHQAELLAVNEAALRTANFASEIKVSKEGNTLILSSQHAREELELPTDQDITFNMLFDESYKLIGKSSMSLSEAFVHEHPHMQLSSPFKEEGYMPTLERDQELEWRKRVVVAWNLLLQTLRFLIIGNLTNLDFG